MFECCICKNTCNNVKSICFDCARKKKLLDCFVKGTRDEVENDLKNGKIVYGTIFGIKVEIVSNR